MSGPMPRTPDFLWRHANVRDRVRNLETGVHPTGSHLNYYDTFGPTEIALRSASAWKHYESGVLEYHARWQRRTGLVMLSGAVMLKSSSSLPADDLIATLPVEARPLAEFVTLEAATEQSPFRTRIKVFSNGELHVLKDSMTATPLPAVWFDGLIWAVN